MEFARRGRALRRVLAERAHQGIIDFRRDRFVAMARRRRFGLDNRGQHRLVVIRFQIDIEIIRPGHRLIQHRCERIQVGPRRHLLAQGLLWRHIQQRARLRAGRAVEPIVARLPHVGQAEIGQLEMAFLGDQDVLRLDVAMDDVARVECFQRMAHVRRNSEQRRTVERAAFAHQVVQIPTRQVFHDQEDGIPLLPQRERRHDIRMVEAGRQPRLADEPFARARLRERLGAQLLDRHGA